MPPRNAHFPSPETLAASYREAVAAGVLNDREVSAVLERSAGIVNPRSTNSSTQHKSMRAPTFDELSPADFAPSTRKPFPDVRSTREEICSQFDRMMPSTKKTLERLVRLRSGRSTDEDLVANIADASRAIRREEKLAHDPVGKFLSDDFNRIAINALVRQAAGVELNEEQQIVCKALSESSGAGAGWIATHLVNEIFDLLQTFGAWRTLGVRPIKSKMGTFPILTSRVQALWVLTEGTGLTDDATMAGTSVNGQAEALVGFVYISLQLLRDMEDVSDDFMQKMVDAINATAEATFFNGNGVADTTNGGQTGIFNDGSVSIVDAGAGQVSVELLDEQSFTSLIQGPTPGTLQKPCYFWVSPALLPALLRVKDGSGAPLVKTPLESPSGDIFSIKGWPLILTSGAPSTNAVSSKVLAFGHGPSYVVGVRKEIAIDINERAAGAWNKLQAALRVWARLGGKMRAASGLAILRTAAA